MKIGFFTDTYTPQFNGVVTSIELFREELEKQGHDVYVFSPTPKQKNDSKKIIRFPSVKFLFYPGIRVAMPYSHRAIKTAENIKFDIIHSHDPFSIGLFGLWLARKKKIPYVHTYHTLFPEYVHYIWKAKFTEGLAKNLSRDFCNQCDLVISPSTKIERALKKWGVKKPLEILATGIKEPKEEMSSGSINQFRKRYGIDQKMKVMLFLSRIAKEKNIDFLLKVAKRMQGKAMLLIAGDGPYKKELELKTNRMKLNNVIFTGYLDKKDKPKAYQCADVFVFASKSETQGLVIAEAMSEGLPIVAVKDLAINDMVENNVSGYLTQDTLNDFCKKVKKVLDENSIRKKMSQNAKRKGKMLTIDKQTRKLVTLYKETIKNKGS